MAAATLTRSASALRTALVGKPLKRFDAPVLVGPAPACGRRVEAVEVDDRHIRLLWDDGLVLDSTLKSRGNWQVYRQGQHWEQPWNSISATIATAEFVAVCFNASEVETYRSLDRRRHPVAGRCGPRVGVQSAAVVEATRRILTYPDQAALVRDVLVDPQVMRQLGNVFRSELLWTLRISPFAVVGDLGPEDARKVAYLADCMVRSTQASKAGMQAPELAVYGRSGQSCRRCGDAIVGEPLSQRGRMLYYCPGCQTAFDRRLPEVVEYCDPHPAAAKFLDDIRILRRRQAGRSTLTK